MLRSVPEVLHAPDRIRRPAARRGWLDGTPRGRNQFVEVDGPEAIDLVARGLLRLRAEHGEPAVSVNPIRDDPRKAPSGSRFAPAPRCCWASRRHWSKRAFTTGLDRSAGSLEGTDADWAADITGVLAERIRGLAHDMARTARSSRPRGREYGAQPSWMTLVLAAMLGGIGRPGEGFAVGFGSTAGIGTARQPFAVPPLRTGENPLAGSEIPIARIADTLENPGGEHDDSEGVASPPTCG